VRPKMGAHLPYGAIRARFSIRTSLFIQEDEH
jgi:hypothetical protein